MNRIDAHPTHLFKEHKLRPGKPYPFGATLVPGGINFSIFSRHADYCTLLLYKKGASEHYAVIPFRGMFMKVGTNEPEWGDFRIGHVFTMTVLDLNHEDIEYGFHMDGRYERAEHGEPGFFRFDPSQPLMDPYAKAIGGRDTWGKKPNWNDPYQHRSRVVFDDFDWEGDRIPEIPMEDLVIYEAHVRGFTRHPSSKIKKSKAGTFAGLREKIPYLKELGIKPHYDYAVAIVADEENGSQFGIGPVIEKSKAFKSQDLVVVPDPYRSQPVGSTEVIANPRPSRHGSRMRIHDPRRVNPHL